MPMTACVATGKAVIVTGIVEKKTLDPSTVVGLSSRQKQPTIFFVHGPPGVGKTTLGATMSAQWLKGKVLKDTLFFTGEPDGLAAIHARGMEAPQINLVELWEEHGFLKTLGMLPKLVAFAKEKFPGLTRAVLDSATAANDEAESDSKNIDDKRQYYGAILECHRRLCAFIRGAGFDYWAVLAHSKAFSVGETPESKVQNNALRMAGGGAIVPAITGQGLSRYQRMASIQIALTSKDPGAGKPLIRKALTITDPMGFQAKNRYESLFKREEEPDLGMFIDRIEAARLAFKEEQ